MSDLANTYFDAIKDGSLAATEDGKTNGEGAMLDYGCMDPVQFNKYSAHADAAELLGHKTGYAKSLVSKPGKR